MHDLNDYQLQQLLSGDGEEAHAGADAQETAFYQPPPPPQPPTLAGHDQRAIDTADYLTDDGYSGGGICTGNDGGFVPGGAGNGGVAPGQAWPEEQVDDSMMPGVDALLGNENDQWVNGGGVPGVQDQLMVDVDFSKVDTAFIDALVESAMMDSLAENQAAAHPSINAPPMLLPAAEPNQPGFGSSGPCAQVGAAGSPRMKTSQLPSYPPATDYAQPAPATSINFLQAVPDEEAAVVAQMVRVAAGCGNMASREWSEEENQLLRDGLIQFAEQDNITKCLRIAFRLANKTVIDVAYRIRWLSDLEQKKTAAKQAQLEQEKSGGMFAKGKGTKGASRKNNRYPLSKEVLNSKSAKDLIRDNDRFMDKIEEILKTGQVKNSQDYFYYLKINMDALRNKVTDFSTVLEGLSVDDEEWADVLKDRHSAQA